jgi:hypothetical protein
MNLEDFFKQTRTPRKRLSGVLFTLDMLCSGVTCVRCPIKTKCPFNKIFDGKEATKAVNKYIKEQEYLKAKYLEGLK